MALPLSPPFVHPQSTQAPARWQLHQHHHLSHHRGLSKSDESSVTLIVSLQTIKHAYNH
jgi:hypothetical protein